MGNEKQLIACYEAMRHTYEAIELLADDLDNEMVRMERYLPANYQYPHPTGEDS